MKVFISWVLLAVLLLSLGLEPFKFDLSFIRDTSWDWAGAPDRWAHIALALAWVPLLIAGLAGWTYLLRRMFLSKVSGFLGPHLAWASSLAFFSIWLLGWAVQGLLNPWTTALFFVPGWIEALKRKSDWNITEKINRWIPQGAGWRVALALGFFLWVLEALATPLSWDAVVDHFGFAREIARTGFLPSGWLLFNGTVPKAADLLLAGFWVFGGERLAHLAMLLPAVSCVLLVGDWAKSKGGDRRWAPILLTSIPFLMPLWTWGFVEGFLAYFLLASTAALLEAVESGNARQALRASVFLLGVALSVKYTAFFAAAGWISVYVWRWFRRIAVPRWDHAWIWLFLFPSLGWLLRTWWGQGNPVFPLLGGCFSLPVGYSAERVATILRETIPPDPGFMGFIRNISKNYFTLGNGMQWFPVGPLLLASVPWWNKFPVRNGFVAGCWFVVAAITFWGTQNALLRHCAVILLLLAVVSLVAWSRALREHRSLRWLLAVGWCACFVMTLSGMCKTTAPFASALGLESGWKRLARQYYMDEDARSAYRWVEERTRSKDRILLFTTYLSYPLERSAFYDIQWDNPTLFRWSAEEGNAEGLARRLKREGVEYLVYHRLESTFLAARKLPIENPRMSDAEWVRFWGMWMESVLSLENTRVYRLRPIPLERGVPLVDLPGIQEKALAAARHEGRKGGAEAAERILSSFLKDYPEAAYVRYRRAGLFLSLGRRQEALKDLSQARKDGLETSEFYDLWFSALSPGREKDRVFLLGRSAQLRLKSFDRQPWD